MKGKLSFNIRWKDNTIEGVTDGALEADIKKMRETFCKTITQKAAERIEKFAAKEMEGYYDEYEPTYYKRTNQMYNDSYKQFLPNPEGNIYRGGIEIDSSFTEHHNGFIDNLKDIKGDFQSMKFSEEDIYTSVWDKGWHGKQSSHHTGITRYTSWTETTIFHGMPHRFDRVKQKASTSSFFNSLERSGLAAVKRQKYSVLKFI